MRAWRCAKVINYLRTMPNTLKLKEENEETEEVYLAADCLAGV
jgi:hypothetical protein